MGGEPPGVMYGGLKGGQDRALKKALREWSGQREGRKSKDSGLRQFESGLCSS